MNERIRELIKQATILEDDELFVREVFDKEKFAELIVRECVNVIRAEYVDFGTTAAVNNIEKHFGVEQ